MLLQLMNSYIDLTTVSFGRRRSLSKIRLLILRDITLYAYVQNGRKCITQGGNIRFPFHGVRLKYSFMAWVSSILSWHEWVSGFLSRHESQVFGVSLRFSFRCESQNFGVSLRFLSWHESQVFAMRVVLMAWVSSFWHESQVILSWRESQVFFHGMSLKFLVWWLSSWRDS